MVERKVEDPLTESMNNFHCHMPGGIYRPDSDYPGSYLSVAMRNVVDNYGSVLDQSEDTWPEKDRDLIRAANVKLNIQREIDAILAKDPEMAKRWAEVRTISYNGMTSELREYSLRPVYARLRKKFTEEELSS